MTKGTNRMTKKDLLLEIARDAVCWGEGSDFEWNELIGEFDHQDAMEEHYKGQFPYAFGYSRNWTDEEQDLHSEQTEKLQEQVCSDCLELLKSLMDNVASE